VVTSITMKMKSEIPPISLVIHEGIEEFESEMQISDEGTGGGRLLSRDSATAPLLWETPCFRGFQLARFRPSDPKFDSLGDCALVKV
jgi:hypothetical protein